MRKACPACDVWLEREEGYFLGALTINLIVALLLPIALFALVLVVTWPSPPWVALQVGVPLAMGVTPLLFFPWSRTLWLALDWTFRPPVPGDRRLDHPAPGRGTVGTADSVGSRHT